MVGSRFLKCLMTSLLVLTLAAVGTVSALGASNENLDSRPYSETRMGMTVYNTRAVKEPSVITKPAEPQNCFRAGIPLEVSIPINTAYEAGIEYKDSVSVQRVGGGGSGESTSEHPEITTWLRTLPGKTYQYRAYLENNGKTVYGEWMSYTAAETDSSTILLSAGKEQAVQTDDTAADYFWRQQRIFKFVPGSTGDYTVMANGSGAVAMACETDLSWRDQENLYNKDTFWLLHLDAGTPLYIWYSIFNATDGRLSISPFVPSVLEFSSPLTGVATAAGDCILRVPVTASVPARSDFEFGIQYGLDIDHLCGKTRQEIQNCSTEHFTGDVSIVVIPNKTYIYRAYLRDIRSNIEYYGGFRTIVTENPATAPKQLVLGHTETIQKNDSEIKYFTFTAPQAGHYLFSTRGSFGDMAVMRENGIAFVGSWGGNRTARIAVYLEADETVHVFLEGPLSNLRRDWTLKVEQQTLLAIKSQDGITVDLQAKQAGQYYFSTYDKDDRFLAAQVWEKKQAGEEIVSLLLKKVDGAEYVKVFMVNPATGQPLGPAAIGKIVQEE